MWVFFLVGFGVGVAAKLAGYHAPDLSLAPFAGLAAFATVGVLIAARRPHVPLGWVFLTIGALGGVMSAAAGYLAWASTRNHSLAGPLAIGATWIETWAWYPLIGSTLTLTLLLFPEGLPSRRWRPVLWGTVALLVAITLTTALQPTLRYGPRHVANPLRLPGWHLATDVSNTAPFQVFSVGLALAVVAGICSQVVRFRRSRGVERQQVKWFALSACLGGATLALGTLWQAFGDSFAGNVLFTLCFLAIPASCGVAVFRYRLYDIDRLISRTVSYTLVTGLLVGVYLGCVALLTDVLPFGGSVGTAVSVLVAVGLFAPLRHRVQRAVDRRFNRTRYDAEATVAAFAARLRDQVELDAVRHDLLAAVHGTVQPATASVWLRGSS
jgi:hypothetical protein